jgi:hypothetical protein
VKTFPGNLCIFLPDGSFISGNANSLKKISPSRDVLWEIPGHFHHQLNLSPDNKRILALSSEVVIRNKEPQRDDVLLVIDLNGKILNRMNVRDHVIREGVELLNWKLTPEVAVVKAKLETTHFNSFYEIPENASARLIPYLQPGNYIANSVDLGIFIISSDLKKMLAHHHNPHQIYLHDVQVSPDGTFLYYNNRAAAALFHDPEFSAIQKYDPVKKQTFTLFEATPKEIFYSPACGGVQELGDLIFFNHISGGGFLWSQSRKEILLSLPGYTDDPRSLVPTQQLKLIDVKEFFKNSRP